MTREELLKQFPHASEQFLRANASDAVRRVSVAVGRAAPGAVVERDLRDGPLAAGKAESADPGKFLVRVTSYRRRLIDEDNLCEKYHVDCCRYAGILPGDSAAEAHIETRQEKVRSKAEERTEICIERLSR